jgi:hypothetical protein
MQDQVNSTAAPERVPWNKGKLTGAKPPLRLRPKHVWSIRTKLQIDAVRATSQCSIWQSTASFAAVMSLPSGSRALFFLCLLTLVSRGPVILAARKDDGR